MEAKHENNWKINNAHLIICEGRDDENFIYYFLKSFMGDRLAGIQIKNAGGADNIKNEIGLLALTKGFEHLRSLAIIRDSDDNPKGASQSIQRALQTAGLPFPGGPCEIVSYDKPIGCGRLSIGYALFPNFNREDTAGTLENLCLQALNDAPGFDKGALLDIVDESMRRVENAVRPFRRGHKNRLHAYFSLSNEFVGDKIGEAALKHAFDFSAGVFGPIKELLARLLADDHGGPPRG
jgi:hypothetical protein